MLNCIILNGELLLHVFLSDLRDLLHCLLDQCSNPQDDVRCNDVHRSVSGKYVGGKAMRKPENSVIPCSAEIDLNRITTVGNLTEINWTSKTRKFRGNLTEILMEMLNGNGTGNNHPEV